MTLIFAKAELHRRQGALQALQQNLQRLQEQRDRQRKDIDAHQQATVLLKRCGDEGRTAIRQAVEPVLTYGCQLVYPGTACSLLFPERRGLYDAEIEVREGAVVGDLRENMESGGLCDTVSAAALLAFVKLLSPTKTIILDEKFKFVGRLADRAGVFLREAADRLGIQILMVTHNSGFSDAAHTLFTAEKVAEGTCAVTCVRPVQPAVTVVDL